MKNLVPILDFGHGGLINGVYQTAGKRSPEYDGKIIYEGVSNRWFGWNIMRKLALLGIPYYTTGITEEDMSLHDRVAAANKIYAVNPNAYLFSIHSNAGGGTGIEGFTSRGDTPSDPLAEMFLQDIQSCLPLERLRSDTTDGDLDKEADYQILKYTTGRAFLIELWFMDNRKDFDKLNDFELRDLVENVIVDTMVELYKG